MLGFNDVSWKCINIERKPGKLAQHTDIYLYINKPLALKFDEQVKVTGIKEIRKISKLFFKELRVIRLDIFSPTGTVAGFFDYASWSGSYMGVTREDAPKLKFNPYNCFMRYSVCKTE